MRHFAMTALLVTIAASTLSASGITLPDMQPAKGDKATYKVTDQTVMGFEGTNAAVTSKGEGTQSSEVVALTKGHGTTVYAMLTSQSMKRTQSESKKENTSASQTLEICRATDKGLYVDANINFEDGEDDSVDVGGTLLQMRLPCLPGTTWTVGRLTYKDGFNLAPHCEAAGYETVQVPAGTFQNCLKVTSSCPDGIDGHLEMSGQRMDIVSGEMQSVSWYYPQVGIVKEIMISSIKVRPEGQDQMNPLRMDSKTLTELASYSLGKR